MTKQKRYYTLLENINGKWTIQFGDYSREVVRQEMEDQKEAAEKARKGENFKVIVSGDSQAAIEAEVAKMNEKRQA